MIKFEIKNRFSGAVQFTAEINCKDDASTSYKIGLAVKWAIKSRANLSRADLYGADLYGADLSRANLSGANLSGANLSGANLSGANLSRANLSRADLYGADLSGANLSGANLSGANLSRADLSKVPVIDGGCRSDGYRFLFTNFEKEGPHIKAGCRNFGIAEAIAHWRDGSRKGSQLGRESLLIIDYLTRMAFVRGWIKEDEQS